MAEIYPKRVSFNHFLRAHYAQFLIGALVLAGLYIISGLDYLLFHSLVELFSTIIAFTIFVLIWNSRSFLDNGYLRLLGIAYLFIGGLDLLHAMAYKGMTVFPGTAYGQPNAANLATQLWLAGRYVQGATMAIAPLFLLPRLRRANPWTILSGFTLITALLLLSIAQGIFPASYLDSTGLTAFKIDSEFIIILLFAIGLLGLLGIRGVREAFDDDVRSLIAFSLVFNIIAEIAFTNYLTVYDWVNLAGHFFKILAVYLIYQAIIVTGLLRPYNLLFRDLAQRETALRASEARERARVAQMEAIMDVVPAIVWIAHDPGARNVTGNNASAELLNLPPNANHSRYNPDVAGRFKFYDQDGKELTPETLPLHQAAATGRLVRDFQEKIVSSDGVERHVYGNVIPLLDEAGNPAGAVGAFIDITERVLVEEALRQGEARLRRLVESNIIGIIFSRGGGNVTMVNDALLEIIGYTRAEFDSGQINWLNITPPEYRQRDADAMAEANQRGACTPYEKEFTRKDGTRASVLVGFTYNKEDQAPYVGFILDLSPQKQAEEEVRRYAARLEQSNRELQDFAFVASHDLQEPLRKIQAFGERLSARMEGQLNEDSRDYLERMLSAAGRMRAMINDLLALSRVTTQGRPFQQVDLNDVAREVLSDLETRTERTGGRVEVEDLPTIEADPLQMHQLLQNLAGNGLKFHKADVPPVVRLYADCPKESRQVIIYVEDNGIGFEAEYLDRIFQPFQRLHGMSQYEGSGMGLAICRKIVERHAGKITARSAPGEGATFIITLPVRQPRRSDST